MAQYQVPQFLDVEDRLFGPFTTKQFLYAAGGIGLFFISWALLPRILAILIGVPALAFFMSLAFLKVNNRPFAMTVESAIQYFFASKLYIWNKIDKKPTKKDTVEKTNTSFYVPKLSESKLKDISWELDIHDTLEGPKSKIEETKSGIPLQL